MHAVMVGTDTQSIFVPSVKVLPYMQILSLAPFFKLLPRSVSFLKIQSGHVDEFSIFLRMKGGCMSCWHLLTI